MICFLLVIGGLWINKFVNEPRDLGPKLQYIGKVSNDNIIGYFLLVAGGSISTDYFYATDMSEDELKDYFGKATFIDDPNPIKSFGSDYTSVELDFRTTNGNIFSIQYYDNTDAVISNKGLGKTNKKRVLNIDKDDYKLIKDSL